MFYDKRYSPEVQEWYYRMIMTLNILKGSDILTLNNYSSIIEELQKLNEQTSVTQRYTRARIVSGLRESIRELAKLRLNTRYLRNIK
jgi:hypothetical protein